MKKTPEQEIRDALTMTGLVLPVSSSGRGGTVELLCRLLPGQEKNWLILVESLLRNYTLSLFIAKQYLMKDNRLVFGWFVKVTTESAAALKGFLPSLVTSITAAVSDAPLAEKTQVAKGPVKKSPLKVVSSFVDGDGMLNETVEYAIPHFRTKDMNAPSKPVWSEEHGRYIGGERGAKGRRG